MSLKRNISKKIIFYNRKILFPNKEVLYLEDWKKKKKNFEKIALERIKHFNQFYNFKYNQIKIKDQKSRWGSCSGKKNINFNYRIFLLPNELRDYIIIHELCHLKEMNHSKNFWDLIALQEIEYKKLRLKLKKYSIL